MHLGGILKTFNLEMGQISPDLLKKAFVTCQHAFFYLHHVLRHFRSGIPRGGVLPYMGYIGMCGHKEYGFSAVLVIDRVSSLANFGHFGHKWGMVYAL